jgi:general secretion pathway protein A
MTSVDPSVRDQATGGAPERRAQGGGQQVEAGITAKGHGAKAGLGRPFDNTRNTRFFFASSEHAEALARLAFVAADGNMGIALLTGEIGCGKTLVQTVLRKELLASRYVSVVVENGLLSFDELLLEFTSQMRGQRIMPADLPDRYSRLAAFKETLVEATSRGARHLMLVIDEAQQLDVDTIDALKGLTNIAPEQRNLMTLLLVGQPEIRSTLEHLPHVDQRIGMRYHLNALSREDTRAYVEHRLRVAGAAAQPPFDEDAMGALYAVSRGVPRQINRIAKLALDRAVARRLPRVGADLVERISADFCGVVSVTPSQPGLQ